MKENFRDDVLIRNLGLSESTKNKTRLYTKSPERRRSFLNFKTKDDVPSKEDVSSTESYENNILKKNQISKEKELLPILNYKFNLREITKQIILLEDHLINEKKQCHDCIIKHFLAIEALSEEALTLNKNLTKESKMYSLPDEIRILQKLWYDNKDTKSIETAQKLRKIRKIYMEDSFDVVFDEEAKKEGSCSSKKCIINKE